MEVSCSLALKAVKQYQDWVTFTQLQSLSFLTNERNNYLLLVPFHCVLIGPMIVTVPDVPSLWERCLWVASNSFTLVDKLGWEVFTCH